MNPLRMRFSGKLYVLLFALLLFFLYCLLLQLLNNISCTAISKSFYALYTNFKKKMFSGYAVVIKLFIGYFNWMF